jgi:hypothetical protein
MNSQHNYTKEELEAIEENAGYFFSPAEIAKIIECETNRFIIDYQQNKDGIKSKYDRGYYLAQAKLRKGLIELATKGSNTAISDTLKILGKLQLELENYE